MTVGSLFSGIEGIGLGLERTGGYRVIWQSEVDPFACRVLERRFPDVPNLGDITAIDWTTVERPDVLCGGFPCQDISNAHTNGTRDALAGKKSGLWEHYRAAIAHLQPSWIIVENVAAWRRWVPSVRSDLAWLGYASVPLQLSAGSFGAPHRRPRIFLVAHPDSDSEPLGAIHAEALRLRPISGSGSRDWRGSFTGAVRVDDGLPRGVDRLRALGNAVVPAVAEHVGRLILEAAA